MPNEFNALSASSIQELTEELNRRCATMVFAATYPDEGGILKTIRSLKGDAYATHGLSINLATFVEQKSVTAWNNGVPNDFWRIQ